MPATALVASQLQLDLVERCGVVPKNFLLHLRIEVTNCFSDPSRAVRIQARGVREVGFEHYLIGTELLDGGAQSLGFEPEATVELTFEVFGRFHG